MTIGSHTPATPIDVPTSNTLAEDVTQADLLARPPAPVALNEEPMKDPSISNQLGESYVAFIQQSRKHIPLHCTDVEAQEHLTNYLNEQLNAKIFNTFKDLFSNVNLDSIQEIYPKISIYSKIIAQYVEETNIKYGINLEVTKLEAPEVGLWEKAFQVAGHNEDQQLSKQLASLQQLEPPKPQPHQPPQQQAHQHTQQLAQQRALLTNKLSIPKQQT